MKKKIIRYTLCGIAIFVIVVSIGILCVNKFIQNKQESRAENYNLLAQYVFELYDEEKIELEKEYLETQSHAPSQSPFSKRVQTEHKKL